ncbi:MAG: hypothetical protein JXB36_02675 [Gammaproteobacteria bacterium]|nr:hypothetical protein [Gammaproteobacteria bacterium]
MNLRASLRGLTVIVPLFAGAFVTQPAAAADKVTALDIEIVPPTVVSGGVDWKIYGDDNRNASVKVVYREVGSADWEEGLDLFRLQNEDMNPYPGGISTDSHPSRGGKGALMMRPLLVYDVPNMFSGSLFDLEPDTAYEVRVTMSDPDGVQGEAVQMGRFNTRREPATEEEGGNVYHVYPWDYSGPRIEPSFTGLIAAYYREARHADWSTVGPIRVEPGDTIVVHAGVYRDNREHYNDGVEGQTEPRLATPFDGTYYLVADGTPELPITIKAAGDGEVIFDGAGNAVLFNMMGGDYHHFDGISVRNTEVGFLTGIKGIAGSDGFALTNSRIEDVGRGIQGDWAGSDDYYIADNVFVGRHSKTRLLGWTDDWKDYPGFPEKISGPGGSEYAVKVYGRGHVVAYNDVRHFHDGIDVATYGAPEEDESLLPVSIDIYGNFMNAFGDNCIEADGGARNIRVFDNICFNAVGGAYSAQTIFGGPAYFIRNVMVAGVGVAAKLSITPAGVLHFNNTYVGENQNMGIASNLHFINNLFVSHGGQGSNSGFGVNTYTNYSSSDYNGFYIADSFENAFSWASPPKGVAVDYENDPVAQTFGGLPDYAAATGQDAHSIMFDPGSFVSFTMPDNSDMSYMYPTDGYDLRLKRGSAAIDRGKVLPNVTDDYRGSAPDLGAYELGGVLPQYGPRN